MQMRQPFWPWISWCPFRMKQFKEELNLKTRNMQIKVFQSSVEIESVLTDSPVAWNRISKKTFPTAFRCRPPRGGALSDRLPVKRNINWISAATHSNETRVWCMHTCIRTFFLFHFVFLLALCLLPIFLFFPFLYFPFLSFPFLFLEWFACGPLCKWSREIEGFPLSGILTAKHKAATATHWKRNTERQHWKSNEKETMSERNRSSNNRNENDIKD